MPPSPPSHHALTTLAPPSHRPRTALAPHPHDRQVVFLGKASKNTPVSEIATMMAANLVTVSRGNPIDRCMEKMIDNNCRHLLVREEKAHDSEIVGMISVKDIVKCTLMKHNAQIQHMKDIVTQQNQMSGL